MDDDSRCYYVVRYDYTTNEGIKVNVERVFDVYDDAKDYTDFGWGDNPPVVEKRKYGEPYVVTQKPKVDEVDISRRDHKIKVLEINDHTNHLIIEHLNEINKAQKEQYEAIIEKMTRFFIKEINDVLDQKTT